MSETILVTSGNIGNAVIEGLLRKGKKVRVTTFGKQPDLSWKEAGVEQVPFDFARPETLEHAFDGIEAYFSVSPLIRNLAATGVQSIKEAKRAGVKRIVRSSILGAADDSITFPRWHRTVEREIEESGIKFTILQPTALMQNFLLYRDSICKEGKFYASLADAKVAWLDARDVAEAAVIALTESGHESKHYKLTGSKAISYPEIANIFAEEIGRPAEYVAISHEDAKKSMLAMGTPGWMIDGITEVNQISAQGRLAGVEPDLAQLLGREPCSFQQFLRDSRGVFA